MKTYIVQSGDWLSKIASKLGVTQAQLLQWNPNITNPDLIEVGQRIVYYTPGSMSPIPAAPGTVAPTVLPKVTSAAAGPSFMEKVMNKIKYDRNYQIAIGMTVLALGAAVVLPKLKRA